MPAPVLPTGLETVSSDTTSSVAEHRFVFLLAVVSVFLLVISLFLSEKQDISKPQTTVISAFVENFKNETSQVEFSGSLWKKRFFENMDSVVVEKDTNKQFELLSTNFRILADIYVSTHDPQVRKIAEELRNFLKTNFLSLYREEDFIIQCLDGVCAEVAYSQEEEKIINLAQTAPFGDPKSRDDLLRNIETAALSADPQVKWQSYDSAFRIVTAENSSDPKFKELPGVILELIKTKFPEIYNDFEKIGFYKLD